MKTCTAWFKTFPRRRNSQEAFRPGNVPMTFSSALPNFHHTWLSFQTHVARRRSSQQVGSYFAHQHPHLEVCAFDRGKVTLCILNRSIQSFSESSWLALVRSPFGFSMAWRCVIHWISYSSSCRVAVFSQDCSAHSWRQNVSFVIQNGLPNEHALFRNVPKALNRSVFSFSLKAVHFDSQTDCWISMRCLPGVSVENNDRWGCRNRQVTLIMFMSGVLQLCKSFGLSRFRRQRIGAQASFLSQ